MPEIVATSNYSFTALHAALRELPEFAGLERAALEPAGFAGTAHDHVRIKGTGLVLRLPRVSQWGLPAEVNLAYQAAGFRRAAPSGHTPKLHALLPPGRDLPMGALVVEEIPGRKPRLPDDLDAIAAALRAIHALPVPASDQRRPLLSPERPLDHLLKTIEVQAAFLERAGLARESESQIRAELDWARDDAASRRDAQAPRTLIGTDSHPGNFVIHPSGKAYFVDLEKTMYSLPAIDLAHATLYTSTRFDPDIDAALAPSDTAAFYRAYLSQIERRASFALMPWLAPVRRFVWLRTLTWCAKWRVESQGDDGWSRLRLDQRARAHMEACLEDFFAPATIERIRAEWLENKDALATE